MNKNITILVILLSIIISFGCKKETAIKGIVNTVIGSVTIKKDEESHQAKAGDSVVAGMTIETAAKSITYISFKENVIALTENSILTIEKLNSNAMARTEQAEFNLTNGEIFCKIGKKSTKGDSYKIKTPTTVAAVRGTEFGVFEKNGESTVACLSGKVEAANTTLEDEPQFVEISANQETQIVAGKPLEVKPISEANKRRMQNVFDNINKKQRIYISETNDSLWKISQKFYNDASLWNLIYTANKEQITNPNLIFPGQQLIIPNIND